MAKNYYLVLGIHTDATQDEIKSAYRKQVKQLHPDHYGEDSKPFLELREAYDVLGEPQSRQAYDHQRQRRAHSPKPEQRASVSESSNLAVRPIEFFEKPCPVTEVFPKRPPIVDRGWLDFFW
ncbi:MAG: J domain-containing protein [bacterium]